MVLHAKLFAKVREAEGIEYVASRSGIAEGVKAELIQLNNEKGRRSGGQSSS